nr:hypothetical protein [uncultured Acetatifactor sp.]
MTNSYNYFVDMEQRFNDYQKGKMDMRALHPMVYDTDNVAFALRQLSKAEGGWRWGLMVRISRR